MNYDASKNTVEASEPKAESDQVGTMLMAKDGSMPGMSDGKNATVGKKVSHLKIFITAGVFLAVLVIGVVIFFVVNSMKVDYSGSYKVAKDLKSKMQELRADESCKKVMANSELDYVKMESYASYIDACKNLVPEIDELAEQLGKTEGVNRNGNIENAYNDFLSSFNVVKEGEDDLAESLEYYRAWHEWVLAQEKVEGWEATEAELTSAVKSLTESGNPDFKKYGQTWFDKKLKANTAYRAFHYSDILAKNRAELLKTMNSTQKDFADWVAKNSLDVKTLIDLSRSDNSKVYSDFDALYALIKENYEGNYNHGSGDCLETFTDVVCD